MLLGLSAYTAADRPALLSDVRAYYIAYTGRDPLAAGPGYDPDGLNYWTDQIIANGWAWNDFTTHFNSSVAQVLATATTAQATILSPKIVAAAAATATAAIDTSAAANAVGDIFIAQDQYDQAHGITLDNLDLTKNGWVQVGSGSQTYLVPQADAAITQANIDKLTAAQAPTPLPTTSGAAPSTSMAQAGQTAAPANDRSGAGIGTALLDAALGSHLAPSATLVAPRTAPAGPSIGGNVWLWGLAGLAAVLLLRGR